VLELTHNHGTETQADFAHFTGNEADKKGFGHIGFLVEDVEATCKALEELGASFKKKPMDGTMKGLAFAQVCLFLFFLFCRPLRPRYPFTSLLPRSSVGVWA
jgi:catechol 2,3-dioxygenase-like lactoylglutathione lyase family enzyme